MRALLSAPGVRVKEPAVDNMAALHFAAQNGHAEICRLLITAGTPVNIKNKKGITALHFACVKGALLSACAAALAVCSLLHPL